MVELKQILNKRTYLMGFACILIMIFHSDLSILNSNIIKSHLYIGVDMFLFLSGIGIAQSLKKKDIKLFYKTRLNKILTISVPLITLTSIMMYICIDNYGIIELYSQVTFTNFLFSIGKYTAFLWYIPAIIIFYMLSPFIYKYYITRENKVKSTITLMGTCILLMIIASPDGFLAHYQIMINRLPIYIIGLIYGIRISDNETMSIWELICFIIMSLVGIVTIYVGTKCNFLFMGMLRILSFIPIVIILSIALTYLINKLEKKVSILNVIGKYTLAIYITHEALFLAGKEVIINHNIKNIILTNHYTYAFIIIVLSITISIIYIKIINYIQNNKIIENKVE